MTLASALITWRLVQRWFCLVLSGGANCWLHINKPSPEMRRLKQLEDENAKLKKIVADLTLDREMLQDVIH
jgi:hypothetical protein